MIRPFNDPVLSLHSHCNFFVAATSKCIKVKFYCFSLLFVLKYIDTFTIVRKYICVPFPSILDPKCYKLLESFGLDPG